MKMAEMLSLLLGKRLARMSSPTTQINGLPLPQDLLDLIAAGKWRIPEDRTVFDALFPEHAGDVSFYSTDDMHRENRSWPKETSLMFVGVPDHNDPPGDIDPKKSVLIAFLGTCSDQPIAIDYRTAPPQVLTLHWSQDGNDNRWKMLAPDIRSFAKLIGVAQ